MFDTDEGYAVSRVVCIHCGAEWVAVRPSETDNRNLECPKCGKRGAEEWQDKEEDDNG